MSPAAQYLLQWLSKEDFSQYGECQGAALDELVAAGLAIIHPLRENQSSFIAKGATLEYCAVSLTDAGRAKAGAA